MRGFLLHVQPSTRLRSIASSSRALSDVTQLCGATSRRDLGDALSGLVNDVKTTLGDAASGRLDKATGDIVQAVPHLVQHLAKPVHDTDNNGGSGGSGGGESGSGNVGDHGGGPVDPAPHTPPAVSRRPSDENSLPTQGPPPSGPPYDTRPPPDTSAPISGESRATLPPGGGGAVNGAPNPTGTQTAHPSAIVSVDPSYPPIPQPASRGRASYPTSRSDAENTSPGAPTQSPTNGLNAGSGVRHRFPLAAAAAIGAVLGFLVVSAIIWGIWFYLRKRRRTARAYPHPRHSNWVMSLVSDRTVSTVPLFVSASEAGVRDENPFRHPRDVDEDDPFDAASLWSASTKRSASTLSV